MDDTNNSVIFFFVVTGLDVSISEAAATEKHSGVVKEFRRAFKLQGRQRQ